MRKRVLLVGTSYSAAAILSSLKSNNCDVAVCGDLPDDPCHAFADQSYCVDYADREQLLEIVRNEQIRYLCPSCNDYSYLSCAWVAEACGLPGYDPYETTVILHRKSDFRQFLEKHGLPTPRIMQASQAADAASQALPFPVLAKPVDSFCGRGVKKVMHAQEISDAVDAATVISRTGEVVLEEFVEGNLYSHSAFIRNGQLVFDTFVDEYCTVYPYQVDCSNAPTSLPEALQVSVRESIRELVALLSLTDGLLHTQFIANEECFWLIECMRRCPGDLYYKLVEASTGVNGHDLYILPFIGQQLPESVSPVRLEYCARHTISVPTKTVVFSLSHSIPGHDIEMVMLKESCMVLDPAPYDKLGIVFAKFSSLDELKRVTPRLADYINLQEVEQVSL